MQINLSPQQSGDLLPVQQVYESSNACHRTPVNNLVNGKGMSNDTHQSSSNGDYMWLTDGEEEDSISLTFDFYGTYPISEMWIWNYNQSHPNFPNILKRGLKNIRVYYSLDKNNWKELKGVGCPYQLAKADGNSDLKATNLNDGNNSPIKFDNVLARYVQISFEATPGVGNWEENEKGDTLFGLSQVRFYVGKGLAAVPNQEWTELFQRTKGWTGADGIYSIPFNGYDNPGKAKDTKTVFVFGDTFIGEVDEASNRRLESEMINNSLGILEGSEPNVYAIKFQWKKNENDQPDSIFIPTTPKGKSIEDSYYWLQDGISIDGTFYCMPMIIGPNPNGPEGFEFEVHGVTCVSAPLGEDGPKFESPSQIDTPLYFQAKNGKTTYFGAGFMSHTKESGSPHPDGYIYIYGLQKGDITRLVVARVQPENFTSYSEWEFWDGSDWSSEKENAAPISDEISSETSVSYMTEGFLAGKYVAVFQKSVTSNEISVYIGNSPVGPFVDSIDLYYCSEPEEGKGVYAYNAKGHPHLSNPGELLTSYNVNTTRWDMHDKDGSIYRPKFLTIKQIY